MYPRGEKARKGKRMRSGSARRWDAQPREKRKRDHIERIVVAAVIIFAVSDGYFDRFAVAFSSSRAKFDGASNHADFGIHASKFLRSLSSCYLHRCGDWSLQLTLSARYWIKCILLDHAAHTPVDPGTSHTQEQAPSRRPRYSECTAVNVGVHTYLPTDDVN